MATSFDAYRPFDAGAGANVGEAEWRAMARLWHPDGPLISGQTITALEPYADSSGMQVKVRAGEVWIRGHHASRAGEATLPVGANTSGATRTDLVVARADFVNNIVELEVVQGASGGGAPAVTQSASMWEIALASVVVTNNASTISAANVVDVRELVGHATGTYVGNALTASPAQGSGASVGTARWERVHRVVTGSGYAFWSAAPMGFGTSGGFTIPFAAYTGPAPGIGVATRNVIGSYIIRTAGGTTSSGLIGAVSATQARSAGVGPTSIGTGDEVAWQLSYIAAR